MGSVLQNRTRSGTIGANAHRYGSIGIIGNVHASAEAQAQIPYRTAGVISKMEARLTTNGNNGTTTLRSRIGGANGTLVCSIATGVTGLFSDTTHSDNVAAGDLLSYDIIAAGASGSIVCFSMSTVFTATTGTVSKIGCYVNLVMDTASTTFYFPISGYTSTTLLTDESDAVIDWKIAGTLSDLQVYIYANGSAAAATLRSRINGGNGNLVISITAGATGQFEDTAHTDSLSVGDDFNLMLVNGAGTVSLQPYNMTVEFSTVTNKYQVNQSTGANINYAASDFYPIFSSSWGSSTEYPNTGMIKQAVYSVSIDVKTNDCAAGTFCLRKNGSDTALTVSITASTTGIFENTTNLIIIDTSDTVIGHLTVGAGSNFYQRSISYVAGQSVIKTINGLAIASVKTFNGLTIASVKTINGLF